MNLKIILCRPRNPGNIGAAARAMANFGLGELAAVNPHIPVWNEAVAAVGADDIIGAARVCATVAEAVSDCVLVLGTSSLQRRAPDRNVVLLENARAYMAERLAGGAGKAGILFGPEKTGLSNSDLSHCHAVINIPTRKKQPSINLAQAVALVCYELAGRSPAAGERRAPARASPLPSMRGIERLTREICAVLEGMRSPGSAEEIRRGLLDARLAKGGMARLRALLRRVPRQGTLMT